MKRNIFGGKLIAIDGPNGVGKSTLIDLLQIKFIENGFECYTTKEPSSTSLGNFVREYSENNGGVELACLVAANRYEHINNEIIPKLSENKIVISDRYFLSSLILQRMDGVGENFIFDINQDIILPDLQVAILSDKNTIRNRLEKRDFLTRFEKDSFSEKELLYTETGIKLMSKIGINTLVIKNDSGLTNLINSVNLIFNEINNLGKN